MKCRLVLEERVPGSYSEDASGNNFLFRLLGVESVRVVPAGSDMAAEMEAVAGEVESAGRKPYVIPGGGSNPIGATGYVACAQEILTQTFEEGVQMDHVVTASGSSGTHAGLVTGLYGDIPVVGIDVSRPKDAQEELVYGLVRGHRRARRAADQSRATPYCASTTMSAPGTHGRPRRWPKRCEMLARLEGILLDPVYTGKTMAGLIDLTRRGFL